MEKVHVLPPDGKLSLRRLFLCRQVLKDLNAKAARALVTRVDAASDPTRIGSDQVRGVRFEGERMVLIPPPRLTGENEETREITWERIATE
jgi:hypothetical protein